MGDWYGSNAIINGNYGTITAGGLSLSDSAWQTATTITIDGGLHWPSSPANKPDDSAVAWLDRRVNEMRVKL